MRQSISYSLGLLVVWITVASGQTVTLHKQIEIDKQKEQTKELTSPPALVERNRLDREERKERDRIDPLKLNWLSAETGRYRFADGLLTIDPDDLRRFVATGKLINTLKYGPAVIETRVGTFLSTDGDPDDSVDTPASVVIRFRNRLMAGAKGYRLGAQVIKNGVKIVHWNGKLGCSVKSWKLVFVGERLKVDKIVYLDVGTKPCTPEDS